MDFRWFLPILIGLFLHLEYPHLVFPNPLSMKNEEFRSKYGPYAVVAGASEGLGFAWCEELAQRGVNLVMIARKRSPLEKSAEQFREKYKIKVKVLQMDLASVDLQEKIEEISRSFDVGMLVYNAAYSNIGPYLDHNMESQLKVVDVNIRGVVILTHIFGNKMKQRDQGGGIVLMSSMQGTVGVKLAASYAASKRWTTIFAQGLWDELKTHGIDVIASVAGATTTNNYLNAIDQEARLTAIEQSPIQVVKETIQALGRIPKVETGPLNKIVATVLGRFFPTRFTIGIFSNQLGELFNDFDKMKLISKRKGGETGN